MPDSSHSETDLLNATLKRAGVSKTVYALVMPETEAALDSVIDGGDREKLVLEAVRQHFSAAAGADELARAIVTALDQAREPFRSGYREAWTQKQDAAHETFFKTWKEWSSPVVELDGGQFPHMYPTAGASEGLRAAIEAHLTRCRAEKRAAVIHVFEGEYEGYDAYAKAAGVQIRFHKRENWREAVTKIGKGDQFYISQPSAIDGNVWEDFDAFARVLNEARPSAQIMLDLTYVGCVARPFRVKADHPNVAALFFSLSKPFGVYYHRIGGCLSREPYDGLYGNKWFKNLLSLALGTELMKRHGVHDLPGKYRPLQERAVAYAKNALGIYFSPRDVFLLAGSKPGVPPSGMERHLMRGGAGRLCLTPVMAALLEKPEAP